MLMAVKVGDALCFVQWIKHRFCFYETACTCNTLGTVGNHGCNANTGECLCKRNVAGRDCNQCAPNFWGLSQDEEGCKACDCDPGGSYSGSCDQSNGQCQCRPHVTGRRCDQPEEGYFVPFLDHLTYEAEKNRIRGNGENVPRSPYNDRTPSWTGPGFVQIFPQSSIEFNVENIPETKKYDIVVRYEPTANGQFDAEVVVHRPGGMSTYSPCYNHSSADIQTIKLTPNSRNALSKGVCLEKNVHYMIEVKIRDVDHRISDGSQQSILIDSVRQIVQTFHWYSNCLFVICRLLHFPHMMIFHSSTVRLRTSIVVKSLNT